MAALSENDRVDTWATYMRQVDNNESFSITKQSLKEAVDAVDQWVDDNTTSFNLAIPQPARSNLTAKQKAKLLMYVVRKRFEVS